MTTVNIEDFTTEADPLTLEENRSSQARYAAGRIPPSLQSATVYIPQVAEWVRGLVAAAANEKFTRILRGGSLLLLGPTGVGKTWQAYGAVRALISSGALVDWRVVTAPDLFASLRPGGCDNPEQEFAGYATVPVLVLDDLGSEKSSEWTEEYLCRLVNTRSEWERPTLFTSNVQPDQFGKRFGRRVTSRLIGMCTQVTMTGPDRRVVTE